MSKKKLSKWHIDRETVSHQRFFHSFYAFVARPAIAQELERPAFPLSPALLNLFKRWPGIKAELSALLERAVPEAIASCRLNLALLRPDFGDSAEVIREFVICYGHRLSSEIKPVQTTLRTIDREVEELLSRCEGGAGSPPTRSMLLDLCSTLSAQLSGLRTLGDVSDNGE